MFQELKARRREIALGLTGLVALAGWTRSSPRALTNTIDIADMSWMEVRDAVAAGHRTVIVPSGGMEQNGPHMVIGKHDFLVRWSARRIAMALGNTLVAPVLSYVPEGNYDPPEGHMNWPGTMGLPEPVFGAVLEGIARSLKQAGFTTICFIADHGGSIKPQQETAKRLTAEWQGHGVRVIGVDDYWGGDLETRYLVSQGETTDTAGPHASIADTSEMLAIHPQGVDLSRLPSNMHQLPQLGATGDPRRSKVAWGEALMNLKVDAGVKQIRAAMGQA